MPHALVFTKTDKQSDTRTRATVDLFAQSYAAGGRTLPPLFITSAKTTDGRVELLRFIETQLTESLHRPG